MSDLRFRQVHLDFHTSEYIPEVGTDFNGEEFAKRLEKANVDSITCFARCHHGWLYYPSRKHPDLIHPGLTNHNLLLDQIKACHDRGIKVPIYTTVQWDGRIMREHPEWLSVDEQGNYINTQNVEEPHFYHTICLSSGYRKFFIEHLHDIMDVVGVENIDGFFMDILFQVDCCCDHCKKKMEELRLDSRKKAVRLKYSLQMLEEFKTEITTVIKERVPEASVFYNSSHVGPASKDNFKEYSHLELESLPSGGWGYDHFPATSRYARTLGKDMIGMTGKFHTYWGDFHSLKNQAALELECFHMLAMGAGCSIGDQLHPRGRLSEGAYDLIGKVYKSVREKEPYCREVKPVAEIAILTPEEFYPEGEYNLGISPSLIGAVRMLQELSYQFDVIDSKTPMDSYQLIILPDCIYYNEELEKVMKNYIANGGKVIGSYDSCLNKYSKDNIYGITWKEESPYYREFVMPNQIIGKDLYKEEYVMYLRGHNVEANGGEVLMDKIEPYFDRSGKTFCSHQHAPSSGKVGYPEVIRNGNVIYFAHPIFKLYRKNAAKWCKLMLKDAVALCLEHKLVSHNGPSTMITALNHQEQEKRDILHILHYITEKRSEDICTVEDVIPLYGVEFKIYTGNKQPAAVALVPGEAAVPFVRDGQYISFRLDKIEGHCMISIQY
ncbi:alpha-amylase family protein [Lacrimispora sphenoides]|uniref:Beta-galactosidase trimerisation domain-containing protein n=1 Tax=Lacrimispora sphenoides JCM 1415 TaxID=1297793 RepID=A0ABY1CF60_9FIRM|nr:alpha-amylase family protein [Lacrimispora sphenoides]SET99554.1 Beta-galactosidase trimerisation domain-containing protein [[Clostridium] sphenoides JCM 1415]SUY53069.1 Beta-galactosidase trimerisation domain [Lacrimispora sphenoides]